MKQYYRFSTAVEHNCRAPALVPHSLTRHNPTTRETGRLTGSANVRLVPALADSLAVCLLDGIIQLEWRPQYNFPESPPELQRGCLQRAV